MAHIGQIIREELKQQGRTVLGRPEGTERFRRGNYRYSQGRRKQGQFLRKGRVGGG